MKICLIDHTLLGRGMIMETGEVEKEEIQQAGERKTDGGRRKTGIKGKEEEEGIQETGEKWKTGE